MEQHTERAVRPRTSLGKEGPPRSLQKEGLLTNHLRNYQSIIYDKPLNVGICYRSNEKLNESLRHASNTYEEKLMMKETETVVLRFLFLKMPHSRSQH